MNLVVKHNGNPILLLTGEPLSSLSEHIRNGYPDLVEELDAGKITGEEVEDASGIKLSPIPVTEKMLKEELLRTWLDDRLDLENRIRALESKPAVTKVQFLSTLETNLSVKA